MAAIKASVTEVIEQLSRSHGNVRHAAKLLRTSRSNLHKYIKEHPTVATALEEMREGEIDDAETLLANRMKSSDTLLIFFLKTRGRKRGYGDSLELAGEGGGPIKTENKTTLDLSRLTDDELRTLRTLRAKANPDAPADAG